MSVRQPYAAEFQFFFLTRSSFRDGRKHVLLSLFYKSNVLLLLWVYRTKISFELILSCFIIRKQSCCLESKSSVVVLHTPNYTYLRLTFNSQINSCGPSRIARGPDVARGPYNAQVCCTVYHHHLFPRKARCNYVKVAHWEILYYNAGLKAWTIYFKVERMHSWWKQIKDV